MKIIVRTTIVAAVAIVLTACALLQAVPPSIKDNPTSVAAQEKVRIGAEYVMEGFKTLWIPVLAFYRAQPKCEPDTATLLCWKPSVYAKLYHATDIATACMVASTAPGVPIAELQLCVSKVEGAKVLFAQNGLIPKGGTP